MLLKFIFLYKNVDNRNVGDNMTVVLYMGSHGASKQTPSTSPCGVVSVA